MAVRKPRTTSTIAVTQTVKAELAKRVRAKRRKVSRPVSFNEVLADCLFGGGN